MEGGGGVSSCWKLELLWWERGVGVVGWGGGVCVGCCGGGGGGAGWGGREEVEL